MSDESNMTEHTVEDGGLTSFVSSLSVAVNDTYSYASGASLFAALIPQYNRDYAWRYINRACQWLDGYVPTLHNGVSGILSTRLAARLITGLAKQIVGEKLIFRLADNTDKDENTLEFVSQWAEKKRIIKAIYAAIGWSCALGTSLIKLNVSRKNGKEDVWWEAKRFDQCYYLADNEGDVYEATFYIRAYTDTRSTQKEGYAPQYILVEHRYWKEYDKPVFKDTSLGEIIHAKGDRVPMVEYDIYRTNGTIQRNTTTFLSSPTNWEQLPKDIRRLFKNDFANIELGKPVELPFVDLGVEVFNNGNTDLSVPNAAGYGESLIVPIQSDLITYEYAEACQLRDMYNGKGRVYLPKNLSMGDLTPKAQEIAIGGALQALGNDDTPIELMNGVDPEQQKAIVQQFDLRIGDWQAAKENALKDIAIKWGMSAKILASYLAQGNTAQTATQVDSEDDQSIAFINLTRSYFQPTINKLIETTLKYYGKVNNIAVNFATPSLVNKDRLLDRIIKLLDAGLIDIEEAIRSYYPDLSEKEIQQKIEVAETERAKAQEQAAAQFDSFGDYEDTDNFGEGNHYNDLGGKNLNGSTDPAQNEFN